MVFRCSVASLGMNSRMLCTDSSEEMTIHQAVAPERVSTLNIHIVAHSDLVPELLQTNRRLSFAKRPQRRITFSAQRDSAGMCPRARPRGCCDEIIGYL